jgi:pimeloyl-ACP methyl ester carboxylesterase
MLSRPVSTETVTSSDGTTIAFTSVGAGPAIVLVHGAMQAAANFSSLARELSSSFRVHAIDRRGRGSSGPHRADHSLDTEVADLKAVLAKTGARFVFGLSSGALVALAAAESGAEIERLAVYEPPFTIDGADPAKWGSRYEAEIARGATARAMVTALIATGDRDFLSHVPRVVFVPFAFVLLRLDARRAREGHTSIRDLVPTVRYDIRVQREASARLAAIESIRCPLLLLGGDRSHDAIRASLDAFAARMPHARRVELRGVGHIAADDVGRPKDVARELLRFFG